MPPNESPRSRLRLIRGGRRTELRSGRPQIVTAPETAPPFAVQARAFEEDTWLIMSAEPEIAPVQTHPIRLMTDLIHARKEAPGSIVVREGSRPLCLLAVVHDVDCDPTWREPWVRDALGNLFRECEQRNLCALGLPVLGAKHGAMAAGRFARLLAEALNAAALRRLQRLWIIAPSEDHGGLAEGLQGLRC